MRKISYSNEELNIIQRFILWEQGQSIIWYSGVDYYSGYMRFHFNWLWSNFWHKKMLPHLMNKFHKQWALWAKECGSSSYTIGVRVWLKKIKQVPYLNCTDPYSNTLCGRFHIETPVHNYHWLTWILNNSEIMCLIILNNIFCYITLYMFDWCNTILVHIIIHP